LLITQLLLGQNFPTLPSSPPYPLMLRYYAKVSAMSSSGSKSWQIAGRRSERCTSEPELQRQLPCGRSRRGVGLADLASQRHNVINAASVTITNLNVIGSGSVVHLSQPAVVWQVEARSSGMLVWRSWCRILYMRMALLKIDGVWARDGLFCLSSPASIQEYCQLRRRGWNN
jgi:hypothetical protein